MRQYTTESATERGERVLEQGPHDDRERGLEDIQNWGSLLGGGALVLWGLGRRSLGGLFLMGLGAGLIYQGARKNQMLNGALKRMVLHTKASESVEIEKSITVERPVHEIYNYWRRLENLPSFMNHIESIESHGARRSHWVARMPAGLTLEWEAEIIEERENELLAWRTIEGSDIYNEGFVTFQPALDGQGTEIHARIVYRPPAGKAGERVAAFFNRIPAEIVKRDLRNFKHLMEAGEIPTIEGQTSGRQPLTGGGRDISRLH